MSNRKEYSSIIDHYERCLASHGDTHKGVDWPRQESAEISYAVMLDLLAKDRREKITLLDFGCGLSHFYEFIVRNGRSNIEYTGLDASPAFIEQSKRKHPGIRYICADVLESSPGVGEFDYVVLNGVLTEKIDLTFDAMWEYAQQLLLKAFSYAHIGMAVNFMSKQVDWERDDLFHLPFDLLAAFLKSNVTRYFTLRHDYGLYQYTAYVYREPNV
jgi:SAM-dependent methyltransferase